MICKVTIVEVILNINYIYKYTNKNGIIMVLLFEIIS